ncbi:MAG: uroporphyrinogen-III C-methyltransferase [Pirellulales bacterium]|nr:uroporphyrinogen-III C-methyltransferase [Pirellulales bacterium]
MNPATGKAYLIGAGPGDPGLLTLRGRQRLGEADVILYDYLVNPRLLDWSRPGAELVCLGRHGQGRIVSQEEIHQRMIAAARAGKVVARLKGGDPAIFGRTAEETAALEAASVPYEIVPGVTSAQAASSYAGVPLTHREAASCVAFVTGQQCRDKEGESLDMEGLARFPGTLVFYMGVTSAPEWSTALLAHGKPGETPVAIVRHASMPQQEVTHTTLAQVPQVLAPGAMRPPAIIIVGEAAAARPALDWFGTRPLFGRTVLVTRPAHQSESLVERLSDLGANVLVQPAIEIGPPVDWAPADAAIAQLGSFGWLVFSSSNGVRYFLERLQHHGLDLRALGGVQLAAIGPGTADALAEYHLRADLQPEEFRAEALAESLLPAAIGKRVLLLRASRGREVLAETLVAAGAEVHQAVVYESRDVKAADSEIVATLRAGEIDWVTVTSSAIARSLVAMLGDDLKRAKLAAISPLTVGALADAGFVTAAVASTYTTVGLVNAILAAESARG